MKKISLIISLLFCPMMLMAQAAPDALTISEPDMRGTARFLGMGGAFGALGGDISVLNQNPGGIGIYRSSDIALTLDLDFQNSKAPGSGSLSQTKFDVNNVGYVGAFKTGSDVLPYFNLGFTYNRSKSFNRHTTGSFALGTSVSNLIASYTTNGNYTEADLMYTDSYNPYAGRAPWISILAYDAFMISPNNQDGFNGLFGRGTSGYGTFETVEEGHIDEYSINFGGNLYNTVYWGMGFGITDTDYRSYTYYGEDLNNAFLTDEDYVTTIGDAQTGLENVTRVYGSGFNFKMGVIVKPINELRFGLAFHTPTYHSLKMERYSVANYNYSNGYNGSREADDGYVAESWYKQSTPWRIIASAAAVVGGQGIVSVDYEWNDYTSMKISSDDGFEYIDLTDNIKHYYKATNTVRVGAEYRVTPGFSVRAGYSYTTSPVNDDLFNNRVGVVTAGTELSYMLPKNKQSMSVGMGYRYKSFYTDLTYMIKKSEVEYHAFSPDIYGGDYESPSALLDNKNHNVVWTIGLRF